MRPTKTNNAKMERRKLIRFVVIVLLCFAWEGASGLMSLRQATLAYLSILISLYLLS